jgi:tagatose 6-phosphate kinase
VSRETRLNRIESDSGATSDFGFVAVSTNPAVDRVAVIPSPPSGVVRASEFLETPGGKAIHTARVATELGAKAAVITTAGGATGERLLALLEPEAFETVPVGVAGATRGTYTLVSSDQGDLVEVHEPSATLTEPEAKRLVAAIADLGVVPRIVAVCGSLPPGAPVDLHARLVAAAKELGAFTILDCSTPEALAAGLAAGPDLVAPNLTEAKKLLDIEPGVGQDQQRPEAIAQAIREQGAAAVWLSLGPQGSLFAPDTSAVRLRAPVPDRIVNAVGCGDALIGGFAAGIVEGRSLLASAKLGAAAAADKLSHLDPGRVDRQGVEARLPLIEVVPTQMGAVV